MKGFCSECCIICSMNDVDKRIVDPVPDKDDKFDRALRPNYLDDMVGQERIK
jgi:hypothetical protein